MKIKIEDDFSNIELLDAHVAKMGIEDLWEEFGENGLDGFDYKQLSDWQDKLRPYGQGYNNETLTDVSIDDLVLVELIVDGVDEEYCEELDEMVNNLLCRAN